MSRWHWHAELQPRGGGGALQLGGTVYVNTLADVLDQVRQGVIEEWAGRSIYDGGRVELRVSLYTDRS